MPYYPYWSIFDREGDTFKSELTCFWNIANLLSATTGTVEFLEKAIERWETVDVPHCMGLQTKDERTPEISGGRHIGGRSPPSTARTRAGFAHPLFPTLFPRGPPGSGPGFSRAPQAERGLSCGAPVRFRVPGGPRAARQLPRACRRPLAGSGSHPRVREARRACRPTPVQWSVSPRPDIYNVGASSHSCII